MTIGIVTSLVPTCAKLDKKPNRVFLPIDAARFWGSEEVCFFTVDRSKFWDKVSDVRIIVPAEDAQLRKIVHDNRDEHSSVYRLLDRETTARPL